jgi:transposase
MAVPHPRKYTSEFKRQAVTLAEELGSASKAARQLGISDVNIYTWRGKLRTAGEISKPVPDNGNFPINAEPPEEELKRLRRENQQLQKANYILKQAAAFFSQDHLK